MKRTLAALLILPLVASAAPSKTVWATVAGYAGSAPLTNFPVLVKLSEGAVPGFHYADCAAGGTDLSFADAAGNALPFDVDTWDASGTSLVWVLLPEVAPGGATSFKIGWADPNPPAANAAAVWTGSGHKGVWHMNSASPADASGSGNDGTAAGSVAITNGPVGSALSYPNTSSYVSCGSSLPEADLIGGSTVEGWVNLASTSGNKALFGKSGFISYRMEGTAVKITTPKVKDYTNVEKFITAANEWHHFALSFVPNVKDGGAKHYRDGVLKASQETTGINNVTGSIEMWLGRNQWGNDQNFLGLLDEYRISDCIRSADWIAADYAQVAGDGFVEFDASGPASMVFFF